MKGKYEMGHLRFRKSIKILPGVKLNLNKKSASVTVGSKGMHHTVSTNGNTTTSVGIPGTGLSYVETKSKKKKGKNAEITEPETTSNSYNTNLEYALPKETKMKKPKKQKKKIIISIIIGILILGIIGCLLPPSLESLQASITQKDYEIGDTASIKISPLPHDVEIKELELSNNKIAKLVKYEDGYATIKFTAAGSESLYFSTGDIKSNSIFIKVTDPANIEKEPVAEVPTTKPESTNNENVPGSGGETSGSTSNSQEEVVAPPPVSTYVWIPQSGSKYHSNPSCSNMENPTQVTKEKAESMGFTPCKKCY